MRYRSLNLSRVGRAILIGISLLLLMNRNAWSQEAIAPNIQPYIDQLTDDIIENNQEASHKLKEKIGMDGMIQALESENEELRLAVIKAFAFGEIEIGQEAKQIVDLFTNIFKNEQNDEIRDYAAVFLGNMGEEAQDAIKPLMKAIKKDPYQPAQLSSIKALVKIAPSRLETIQCLIIAQNDSNQLVRHFAIDNLSELLINIDSDILSQALKEAKMELKKDNDWQVRLGVAEALGRSGRDVKLAVSTLEEVLKSNDQKLIEKNVISSFKAIAKSLSENAANLSQDELVNAKEGLTKAIEIFNQNQDNLEISGENIKKVKSKLRGALTIVNALVTRDEIPKNPQIFWLTIIIILWFSWIFSLLWIRPLWLLEINKFLQTHTDITLPNLLGGIKISVLRRLLFNLHYHPKVLDAWVKLHLKTARKEFQKKLTVKERKIYIPIPVILDDKKIVDFTGNNLKPYFTEQRECLLIWGEGGLGKTSLAYQLADWAMSGDLEKNLCEHQMLPILLEDDLDFPFIEAIGGKLQDLIDSQEQIPEDLLVQLLRKQRLLVIVDHLSEMSETTRKQIRPELPSFSVNALIITSRIEEKLGGINRTTLQPLRVENDQILPFVNAYLIQQGKQDVLKDKDIIEARNQLLKIVGEQKITVLLIKLYIEQMIAAKDDQNLASLPSDVPDLMLSYLNLLNQNVADKEHTNYIVQKNTKIIAWECLKQYYRPTTAKRDDVLIALEGEQPEEHLKYLEKRLHIIKSIGPSEDKIRFSLDPLAEYMAALHIVKLYADNEQLWRDFLARADAQLGGEKIVQGFLRTVQDCCLVKKEEFRIPEFIIEEVSKRIMK